MQRRIAPILLAALLACGSQVAGAKVIAPSGGSASPDLAPSLDQFNAAIAQVKRLAQSGRPPRLSDPNAGPTIRQALDQRVLDALNNPSLADMVEICASTTQITSLYAQVGLDKLDSSKSEAEISRAYSALISQNSVTFQDELITAFEFAFACNAKAAGLMGPFWNSLPPGDRTEIRKSGVDQLQRGIVQMYAGSVVAQSEALYRPVNQARWIDSAVRHAGPLTAVLDPEGRAQVVSVIDQVLPMARPAARAKLLKIRNTMLTASCVDLCKL